MRGCERGEELGLNRQPAIEVRRPLCQGLAAVGISGSSLRSQRPSQAFPV